MSDNPSPRPLPDRASLAQLKKQAKELQASDGHPTLSGAQHALAQSYGFASWPKLKLAVEQAQLRRLIQNGDPEPVAQLLKSSPRLAKLPFAEGDTPLHVAAEENRPAIVELLVKAGAPLGARYFDSAHTALSWSITSWSFDSAEKLVELGDEPDLFCAAGLGHLDRVKAFWPGGMLKPKPSRTGSSRIDANGERRLCPPESDADQVSDALYIACRADRFEVSKWLLEHGADPNFRGYVGATCLAWAEFSGNAELCALLRSHGGSDELTDHQYRAVPKVFPIMVLAGWGFRDKLALRLAADPSLVRVSSDYGTPLHAAAYGGAEYCVRLLLHYEADKAALNAAGKTAADLAREQGHAQILELLQ